MTQEQKSSIKSAGKAFLKAVITAGISAITAIATSLLM